MSQLINLSSWIGVDLDGTLAVYRGGNGIGEPIPLMMARVKTWIKNGFTVKIFTARASVPELILPIKVWLKENGLPDLEVTNCKDFGMIELWDDLARRVEYNTGKEL